MKPDPSWLTDERLCEIKCSSDAGRTTLGEILAMANEIRVRRLHNARPPRDTKEDTMEELEKKIEFRKYL